VSVGALAKVLGEQGIGPLHRQLPEALRTRESMNRLLVFCAHATAAAIYLTRSSFAAKIVQTLRFPVATMGESFSALAVDIDGAGATDRLALERELVTAPLDLLMRINLVNKTIATDYLQHREKDELVLLYQPDFFQFIE
nr:hypothetical protein [Verrucomicrobiota bacterium]